MTNKKARLETILEAMLADDETITARAVVRRSGGVFKNASDITRNVGRRDKVKEYVDKQQAIRAAFERSSKKSRADLERLVASKNVEIERLMGERELLIASHRAMILAMAEMGGFPAWKRFFEKYQSTIDSLEEMGSLPKVEEVPIASREK